jgi:hypothetical protein
MLGARHRRALAGLIVLTLVVALTALSEGPAAASPSQGAQCGTDLSTRPAAPALSVTPTALPAGAPSTVTVTGSRYLTGLYDCAKQRFGGVYLFFGWVQPGGQWGPSWRTSTSMTGHFGSTYSYPGEGGGAETRDDGSGTIRLVSFTSGGTSGSDTPFHMDADGTWSATLVVRGAVYSWKDEVTGASSQVDCRQVQCGVFTIGAHGVASRPNEVFSPVTFASGNGGSPAGPTGSGGGSTTGTGRTGGGTTAPTAKSTGSAKRGAATTTVPVSVAPATELPPGASTTALTAPPATTTTVDADLMGSASERAGVQIFPDEDEGGGAPVGAIAAGVGGAALLAAGATVAIRRRRS